jgi:hypothetical protein
MSIQDVPQDKVFWLHGGKAIKNILELAKELRQMSNETFAHYVNEQKNDFANWIQHCIKDQQLAILVKSTKNKERMTSIIERRIQELTQPQRKERPKQTIQQPTIIRTKNTTPLKISYEPTIIRTHKKTLLLLTPPEQPKQIFETAHKTPLRLAHEEQPKKIIRTPHKTQLKLTHEGEKTEVYVHEVKTHHHSATLLISHLVLGIVIGVAMAALAILLT